MMTAFPKIEGHIWIGQNPMTLDDLSGKVVLVDFWTYSSVNCRRTIPYLREWREKYKDEDFIIIGIHTPEFEFESNPKNVENAVRELGITWSVLLDNDYVNWNNFENDSWPAKYLVDKEGNIVYSHLGEGKYEETEEKIRELLGLQGNSATIDDHTHGKSCSFPTAETFCGYLRGNIANDLSYTEEAEEVYVAPDNLREGEIALNGAFFASPEYVESREEGATISLSFHAMEVNLVLGPERDGAKIEILLDDFSLDDDVRGTDVDADGRCAVNRPDMYNLIKSKEVIDGVIKIRAREGNFRAYVFTFSGCAE
jgi:thiol-disulfide isomerase/thioredoxin